MTTRSVVQIDVDDAKFREFHKLWEKYQGQLKALPTIAGGTATAATEATEAYTAGAAALLAQNELFHKQDAAAKGVAKSVHSQDDAWHRIAASTKQTAANIKDATVSLVKWVGIGTAIGALAGIGGSLWGIDRLAWGAAQGRRSAQGVGVPLGTQQAFQLNYGSVVDPSFLSNIANIKSSVDRAPLLSLGISEQDINGKNAADLGALTLRKLKDLVDKTPDQLLEPTLQAYDPSGRLGFSTEQARRLRATSPEELETSERNRTRDQQGLNVEDQTLRAWKDFTVQMQRAEQQIENTFIKALLPLEKPLENLSQDFVDIVEDLTKTGRFKWVIDGIADGLHSFDEWVRSPEFKTDLQAFSQGVKDIVHALGDAVDWFERHFGPGPKPKPVSPADAAAGAIDTYREQTSALLAGRAAPVPLDPAFRKYRPAEGVLGQLQTKYGGLPTLDKAWWDAQTLRFDPTWRPDITKNFGAGAPQGTGVNNPFNLRARGQTTGFRDFDNADDATRAASAQLLRDYNKYGQHSLREIVGGNAKHAGWAPAGAGNNVDAYVANLARWTRSDPDADYDVNDVAKRAALLAGISRQEGRQRMSPNQILVFINDSTGANVTVQGAQLAPGT